LIYGVSGVDRCGYTACIATPRVDIIIPIMPWNPAQLRDLPVVKRAFFKLLETFTQGRLPLLL
jgi:hypothetical protein